MRKYGIVMVMVMFAVIAFAVAPAVAAGTESMKQSRATVRGSELMGMEVVNANDEEIGSVEDVIIGFDGRVNYLIVEQDGVQMGGDDKIPVPFSAFDRKGREEKKLVLNITEEKIQNAPRFSESEYPQFGDTTYDEEVHGYYGAPTPEEDMWPDTEATGKEIGSDEGVMGGKDETEGAREIDNPETTPAPKRYD